jgi:hypothetical protein
MAGICDTHCAEEKCDGSDEQNPEVGANGTVQWRMCSLPMGLTSGSEFVTHFESSGAERFFLRGKVQMGR